MTLPPRDGKTWIQTVTGRQFWPLNPHPADIDIVDIAHALAMQCRYTGHTRFHYSVGQHSVLASKICEPEHAMWLLLHDASEAYICDIARPVKRHLANYKDYEERLMRVIADKFNLPWPMPDVIEEIDLILLATERRDLMATPPIPWHSTEGVLPLKERIEEWSCEKAKLMFLQRFIELGGAKL